MKKIIITGATSMIGTALTDVAIDEGIEVYAVIRPSTTRIDRLSKSSLIHIVEADLESLKEVNDIPKDCDVLYHFAWKGTRKTERDDPVIQEENIRYTFDAVELAKRSGCKKFIGAGSQAEYGLVDGRIDDKTKFAPVISYGASKYTAGLLSKKLCDQYSMTHIWARIFSVYGRYDNEGTMLDYAIKQFLKGEKAFFSSGLQMWDYLYEKDAGKIFFYLGESDRAKGEYNVANGKCQPIKNYIKFVASELSANELCVFSDDKNEVLQQLQTNIDKLLSDINYTPDTTFEKGVRNVIQEYKSTGGG